MQYSDNMKAKNFSKQVGEKAQRKIKALGNDKKGVWFGLGMMGIVGWSIVVPTFFGAFLGIWFDGFWPETFSWTLTGLILGLLAGCFIAWTWLKKENKEINRNGDDD